MIENCPNNDINLIIDKLNRKTEINRDELRIYCSYLKKCSVNSTKSNISAEFYKNLFIELIKIIEADRKSTAVKKIIADSCSLLLKLKDEAIRKESIKEIENILLNLPYMLISKWELLSAFISSSLIKTSQIFNFSERSFLSIELLACSEDQVNCVKCSSLIVTLSCVEEYSVVISDIIFKAITSSAKSTRVNVSRSWLSRIISFKSATKMVNLLLKKLKRKIDFTTFFNEKKQENQCIVLEKYSYGELEPHDNNYLFFDAFFSICLLLKSSRSQISFSIEADDQVLSTGINHSENEIRFLAYQVCQEYRIFPNNLGNAILEDMKYYSTDIINLLNRNFISMLEKEVKNHINAEIEILTISKENNHSKFYPIRKEEEMCYNVDVTNFQTAKLSLETLLDFQADCKYPSVSKVMNKLRNQNVDERAFVAEMTKLLNFGKKEYENKSIETSHAAKFFFKIISRCPLRAVVDYGGEIIIKLSRNDEEFKEILFEKTLELICAEEENSRPLAFEVFLVATIQNDSQYFEQFWEIFMKIKNEKKHLKMFEMLSNVVANNSIVIPSNYLQQMMILSLKLQPEVVNFTCPQLFAASLRKFLKVQGENERVLLSTFLNYEKPESSVYSIIQKIFSKPPNFFSKKSIQLILHLFSCFIYGGAEFYNKKQLELVQKMKNFLIYVIQKYCDDGMIVYASINAISGILPWEILREDCIETNSLIEELITTNRIKCVFWEKYNLAKQLLVEL